MSTYDVRSSRSASVPPGSGTRLALQRLEALQSSGKKVERWSNNERLSLTSNARRVARRVAAEIEQMVGAALRANGADRTDNVPIAVANLDVDPAVWLVCGQQYRRILAPAFPPVDHVAVVPFTSCRPIDCAHDNHLLPHRTRTE